jgi:hypothetical protein
LELADGLDYSAKLLIGYCLGQAAVSAVDKSKDWVMHANAAGLEDGPSELVIRIVAPNDGLDQESDQREQLRSQLERKIGRLNGFLQAANALVSDLQGQLDQLGKDHA